VSVAAIEAHSTLALTLLLVALVLFTLALAAVLATRQSGRWGPSSSSRFLAAAP
jgi:hypothetical protein